MKKLSTIAIVVFGGVLGLSSLASAQSTPTTPLGQDIKDDRTDLKQDKQTLQNQKQQEKMDAQRLKADKRSHASAGQLAADKAALRQDRQNVKATKTDMA